MTQRSAVIIDIARTAVLAAGMPESVPATTIDRQCGSSQQAAQLAAQGVLAGAYDIAIACGVESMSRVPMFSSSQGKDPNRASLTARYPDGLGQQGISAELIIARWKLTREDLDAYAARSHRLAADTAVQGGFAHEIVPVSVSDADGMTVRHTADETIRPGTTQESLAGLRPAFEDDTYRAHFPEISWSVTPGSSSPLTDGASAALIMSEDKARELGLRPRARFRAFSVVGSDPLLMLTGPVEATRKALTRGGLANATIIERLG